MTLVREWVGRKEKPPVFFDPRLVDRRWSWVYESLIAAWLFNEPGGDTLRDVFARVNGTFVAGTGSKPTWSRDGELWGVTPIDSGGGSGIDLPDTGSVLGDNFTPDQISVETWSRWPVDDGIDPRLFSKQTGGAEADHYIMVGSLDSSANSGEPRFRLKTGGTTITHIVDAGPNEKPSAGDLVHVVWTYNGANVTCYLNAVVPQLSGDGLQTGTVDGGTGVPLRIGNSAYSGAENVFDAHTFKVAIYNRALSTAQVVDLCYDPYGAFRPIRRFFGFPILKLRPDGTVAADGWTAQPSGTLHGVTSDETDTTYAESPATPDTADILKLDMENPATTPTDPVTVRARWRQD